MLREDLKLKIETRLHSLEVTPDSVAVGKGNSKIESIKDSTVDPLKVLIKTVQIGPALGARLHGSYGLYSSLKIMRRSRMEINC